MTARAAWWDRATAKREPVVYVADVQRLKRDATALRGLLLEAIDEWAVFDDPDGQASGADLVEWFVGWRAKVHRAIQGTVRS